MKQSLLIAAPFLLAALAGFMSRPEQSSLQNLDFRLMTIERRLDQLQTRVDTVEREQRMQSLQSANPPVTLTESVLDLKRQQISQQQEIVLLQRQLLDLRKQLDAIPVEGKKDPEKAKEGDAAKEKSKPAEPARRRP